jgi:anti-sigma factor RsiW
MNHFTARQLLPAILDHTIPAELEARVRDHADGCGRCQRALAEFEASEALLAQLPAALVPIEPSAEAHDRLASLARWSVAPKPEWQDRIGVSALGALAAAAMLLMVISATGWGPMVTERSAPVTLAAMVPDSHYLPTGWRWR